MRQEQRTSVGPSYSMMDQAGQLKAPNASVFMPATWEDGGCQGYLAPPSRSTVSFTPLAVAEGVGRAEKTEAHHPSSMSRVRSKTMGFGSPGKVSFAHQHHHQDHNASHLESSGGVLLPGSVPNSRIDHPPRSAMSLTSANSLNLEANSLHLTPSAEDLDLRDLNGNVLLANASPAVRRSIRHLSSAASLSAASLARSVLEGLGASDKDCLQQTRLFALQVGFPFGRTYPCLGFYSQKGDVGCPTPHFTLDAPPPTSS